jgi:hypothetical protein
MHGFRNKMGRSYKILKWRINQAHHTVWQENVKLIK